ncbi:hypothetical protein E2562_035080 [Oryza meyeriana var. granulata]|uniref:Uncharacterized protein n=1 Tax=Oryza meyeriana var. granulata TaxID=110450 RepID=A0A6G1FF87_9ORYZ|nr:hypothetical protein E2562_035080 [Oryza meyeriana var. granulata]
MLLDTCNAITARLDRLCRRRLLSRFTLHLLSSSPPPSSVRRSPTVTSARRRRLPHRSLLSRSTNLAAVSPVLQVSSSPSTPSPRSQRRPPPPCSALAALATKAGEVDAVDKAVRKLTSVLDNEGDLDEAALQVAAQEVEKRMEELTAPLDRLSD